MEFFNTGEPSKEEIRLDSVGITSAGITCYFWNHDKTDSLILSMTPSEALQLGGDLVDQADELLAMAAQAAGAR